jgi:hypothetical protein
VLVVDIPGIQQADAEKFDRIFESNSGNFQKENVCKMLANGSHKVGGSG